MSEPTRSVLGRVLDVVEAFGHGERQVILAELTRRTGLPKPTVHRIAGDLVEHGVLERADDGYRLGTRLFVLGERVPRQSNLRPLAVPYLEDLYEATHENVNLGVLHGCEVLYLARVQGHRSAAAIAAISVTGKAGRIDPHGLVPCVRSSCALRALIARTSLRCQISLDEPVWRRSGALRCTHAEHANRSIASHAGH